MNILSAVWVLMAWCISNRAHALLCGVCTHVFSAVYVLIKMKEEIVWDITAHVWKWTHWGRMMHICIDKLTIIGSDNGLFSGRHQAIIWTNGVKLLIGPLGTNFSEI